MLFKCRHYLKIEIVTILNRNKTNTELKMITYSEGIYQSYSIALFYFFLTSQYFLMDTIAIK